jgi:hypothetical protein
MTEMGKLIISPLGIILFFVRCIIAFSWTTFWYVPLIRSHLNEDGWLTFWFLLGLMLILTFKIKFNSNKKSWA